MMLHMDLLLFTAFNVCVSVAVQALIQYYSQIATKKCVCVYSMVNGSKNGQKHDRKIWIYIFMNNKWVSGSGNIFS